MQKIWKLPNLTKWARKFFTSHFKSLTRIDFSPSSSCCVILKFASESKRDYKEQSWWFLPSHPSSCVLFHFYPWHEKFFLHLLLTWWGRKMLRFYFKCRVECATHSPSFRYLTTLPYWTGCCAREHKNIDLIFFFFFHSPIVVD